MFNLEKSIAEWRQQMLAAGIKTPVPLEELECHLREEIERQMESGTSEQQAFETTVSRIGQGTELKAEFEKDQGLLSLWVDNKSMKAYWLWALLWLVLCSWVFFQFFQVVVFNLVGPAIIPTYFFILAASYVVIYGAILFKSLRPFCTAKTGKNFIKALEDELRNKPELEHRILGWIAAGFVLWKSVYRLNYFAFFPYHPVAGITHFNSQPVPIPEYLIVTFNIVVAEMAIWSLAKASRDKVSRFISLIGSVFLVWLAFANYIGNAHTIFENVFNEIEPYRAWFQWVHMVFLLMPCFFVVRWERRHAIRERLSAMRRKTNHSN